MKASLHSLLKQYFGFTTFRPLQQEIILDALAARDVFAVLPTGGGKSLCFQLPAVAQSGVTVVISPLIALMKDQVDSLTAAGVAATFLNSTLNAGEARQRIANLHANKYRLLYLAPERLMIGNTLDLLKRCHVNLIAIDEAHCISEWGHDFRPEYRQIAQLREVFPKVPFMTLTATATERVRSDIVKQLKLRDPRCYIASFNRPNLIYRVLPKQRAYDQLVQFVRARDSESGIIYCQSRRSTEQLAEKLSADRIKARPYHAGLENAQRAQNQELFIRDEVRVICATIAFGMGINKPNVRYVVHYDLPKNIEGYYQETGRAGRDGLPAECLLLFSPGDAMKQVRFIDEKPDERERQIGREQLDQMVQYAERGECRRGSLLQYFGEKFPEPNCSACDNCLAPRDTYDGTLAAQKFLSCVYRVRERGGFSVGIGHIVEILTGADTEKVRRWEHEQLSTYGIGKDIPRAEWLAIGRELIRLGHLRQLPEKFNVLELTEQGLKVLRSRQSVPLTRPMKTAESKSRQVGQISCDERLFEVLRRVRKTLADAEGVPPYIVFSDVALRQMARLYPLNERQFARISGVSQRKLAEYGITFMAEISEFLKTNPRQIFADDLAPGQASRSRSFA